MTSPTSQTSGNTFVPQFFSYELEDKELRPALIRRDTQLAIALNLKENGIFETVESQNGQQFFGNPGKQQVKRFAFRKVFSFGAIPTGGVLNIPVQVSAITFFTHIYGTCIVDTEPLYRPIPYVSATLITDQIQFDITSAPVLQINITNGGTAPNITSGIIVLEYLKQ